LPRPATPDLGPTALADATVALRGLREEPVWICLGFVDTPRLETEVSEMPKFGVPYPPEFRRQVVELVRSGRTPEDLSREFEPTAQSIWNWVRQAERDGGTREDGGVTSPEREELAKLRRENHRLRQERDILAKAAAVGRTRPTARERTPSGSSSS
jgi:transposase